jgi:hypothetical protein
MVATKAPRGEFVGHRKLCPKTIRTRNGAFKEIESRDIIFFKGFI